jgi:hypothetical protein
MSWWFEGTNSGHKIKFEHLGMHPIFINHYTDGSSIVLYILWQNSGWRILLLYRSQNLPTNCIIPLRRRSTSSQDLVVLTACCHVFYHLWFSQPVTVAERSKACTVFARSEAGIVGSNPKKALIFGMCMRLFCVCVALCVSIGLTTGWSLVQGVLPSVK